MHTPTNRKRVLILITVCDNAKETCPVFPGKSQRIHENFEDPPPPGVGSYEERLSIFRRVRDEIREWMKDFISGRAARNDARLSA